MTEENEGRGAGTPGVPPAGGPGERSVPAAPSAIPPKPAAPPTSATPIVPAAAPAPPAPDEAPEAPRPRSTPRTTAAAGVLTGAGKAASAKASQAGSWVRRQGPAKFAAAVAAVVVLGLLIGWLTSLGGGQQTAAEPAPASTTAPAAAASRGPLPLESVGPLDFRPGDCFKDFDPEAPQSTIVDCATGHSAQLIAVHHYQESESYPGLNALKDKGRETCRGAQLTAAATTYELKQRNAYPSSSSWDNGDRRVDCYVTADAGNVIMESLIP